MQQLTCYNIIVILTNCAHLLVYVVVNWLTELNTAEYNVPTPSPSLLLAQAIFEPNLLPSATQTILKFCHS
jgi:hypothetical protein